MISISIPKVTDAEGMNDVIHLGIQLTLLQKLELLKKILMQSILKAKHNRLNHLEKEQNHQQKTI
jgi:hypothetical protein